MHFHRQSEISNVKINVNLHINVNVGIFKTEMNILSLLAVSHWTSHAKSYLNVYRRKFSVSLNSQTYSLD